MGKIIPRIVIEMRGGNIVGVYTDSNMSISVINWEKDVEESSVSRPAGPDKIYPGNLDLSKVLAEEDHHLIKDHPWNKQTTKK